uniref:ATP synthase F0 subunit 8 n=1 Tax=Geukensia demissa TaxID=27807 RepID=A0A6B9VNA2_GEUDE|nr:ATP synthase F0 subunit 8 [Geukensia demissa]
MALFGTYMSALLALFFVVVYYFLMVVLWWSCPIKVKFPKLYLIQK